MTVHVGGHHAANRAAHQTQTITVAERHTP
jgi:hypothetical protein